MEMEAEIKALQSKLLGLETAIQKLASRKDSSVDPAVIEQLSKELGEKSQHIDSLHTQLGELMTLVDGLIPQAKKGGDKNHANLWNFWNLLD